MSVMGMLALVGAVGLSPPSADSGGMRLMLLALLLVAIILLIAGGTIALQLCDEGLVCASMIS